MPFDAPKPYRALLQIQGTSPTRAHLFSVLRSSSLPSSAPSSEQPCCWLVSDENAAPLAQCVEAHGKIADLEVN
jgi:hypothetical protein